MAKVVFEFTCVKSGEYQGGHRDLLDARAYLADISRPEKTGPHDLLANIVLTMSREIIEKARDEMLVAMRKVGMDGECELIPHPANVSKH